MAERYVPQADFYVALVNGNNHDVGGNYTASRIRFTGLTAPATVTGLTLGHPGRVLFLHNDTAYPITLPNNNAGSVAAHRFTPRGGVDFMLAPGQVVPTLYDGVTATWILVEPVFTAGAGTATYKPAGVIHWDSTFLSAAVTTEQTAFTYVLPANTLSEDGASLRIQISGLHANTAGVRTVRIRLGPTVNFTINTSSTGVGNTRWTTLLTVTRNSSNGFRINMQSVQAGTTSQLPLVTGSTLFPPLTWADDVDLLFTVQCSGGLANDTVADQLLIEYLPAPPQ